MATMPLLLLHLRCCWVPAASYLAPGSGWCLPKPKTENFPPPLIMHALSFSLPLPVGIASEGVSSWVFFVFVLLRAASARHGAPLGTRGESESTQGKRARRSMPRKSYTTAFENRVIAGIWSNSSSSLIDCCSGGLGGTSSSPATDVGDTNGRVINDLFLL